MGNSDLRVKTSQKMKYLYLHVEPKHMKYLDEPHGLASGLAKGNLAHQMRYSVETLETELAKSGAPHVLQLQLEGEDERNPHDWSLYADGFIVASGTGKYARECFYEAAEAFREVCRDAVLAAKLPSWDEREYSLLKVARGIARVAKG